MLFIIAGWGQHAIQLLPTRTHMRVSTNIIRRQTRIHTCHAEEAPHAGEFSIPVAAA
jgi:hypothetical protein